MAELDCVFRIVFRAFESDGCLKTRAWHKYSDADSVCAFRCVPVLCVRISFPSHRPKNVLCSCRTTQCKSKRWPRTQRSEVHANKRSENRNNASSIERDREGEREDRVCIMRCAYRFAKTPNTHQLVSLRKIAGILRSILLWIFFFCWSSKEGEGAKNERTLCTTIQQSCAVRCLCVPVQQ